MVAHLRIACLLGVACVVPRARAEPRITPACAPFDHGYAAWTALLTRFVHDGEVDYAGWKREGERELWGFFGVWEALPGTCFDRFSRGEQMAFWINAYNAYTVRLILDHYPSVKSIRSLGLYPGAIFRKRYIRLANLRGHELSLDDIENDELRAHFGDARVHFAINCASRGCPPLPAQAFRAPELDGQLTAAARAFFRDPKRTRYDATTHTLWLSMILKWFHEDFEKAAGSVPGFVARYLPEAQSASKIEFVDYDWTLNGK
jgi:hypothetical protein